MYRCYQSHVEKDLSRIHGMNNEPVAQSHRSPSINLNRNQVLLLHCMLARLPLVGVIEWLGLFATASWKGPLSIKYPHQAFPGQMLDRFRVSLDLAEVSSIGLI